MEDNLLGSGSVINNMVVNGNGPTFGAVQNEKFIRLTNQNGIVTDKNITLSATGWTYSARLYINNFNNYTHFLTAIFDQNVFAIKGCQSGVASIPTGSVYVYTSTTGSKVSKLILPTLQFVKLQVVYDGASLKFYLNDVLVDTIVVTLPASVSGSRKYQVGRYVATGLSEGGDFYIKDLKIFLRSLTEKELKEI